MKQTYENNKQRIYSLGLTADLKDDNGTVHHFVDGYEYIEIGGIKWATCNVGAKKETDTGLYFQWGETKGYNNIYEKRFCLATYKFSNANKYNRLRLAGGLTKLEPCDDAATVSMGKSWRMPTEYDFYALLNATTHKWVNNYQGSGINGILFTSNEDSSKELFFPVGGCFCDANEFSVNSYGYYWSSHLNTSFCIGCKRFGYSGGYCDILTDSRSYYGFSIRGVVNC